jgi:hypothetical protein
MFKKYFGDPRQKLASCAMAGAMMLGMHPLGALANGNNVVFAMVPSATAANCLARAQGRVTVTTAGEVGENMHVEFWNLPPNTAFDFFETQVPNAPFGLAWYQGDIQTDSHGVGVGDFIGIFSKETFIVAPGVAPAPVVFNHTPFPDADTNPKTAPVHTYHLGLWFNASSGAARAGCPTSVTPFNGEHTAGVQAMSTRNYPDLRGPLFNAP